MNPVHHMRRILTAAYLPMTAAEALYVGMPVAHVTAYEERLVSLRREAQMRRSGAWR